MRDNIYANSAYFQNADMDGYAEHYSEGGFWTKLRDQVSSIGLKLIYKALQLYYVAQSPTCPARIKAAIYAALGYLITPFDIIPDIVPVAGYSDDAAAIALALTMAQMYITEEINAQAKARIRTIFGSKAVARLEEEEVSA